MIESNNMKLSFTNFDIIIIIIIIILFLYLVVNGVNFMLSEKMKKWIKKMKKITLYHFES